MDIGTAKPGADILTRTPHRLIDIRDPAEPYSVAEFVVDARRHIAEITAVGRIPLLVGGTMLYFRALLQGLADLPAANSTVRALIEAQAMEHGWPHMHQLLMDVDAPTALKLHPNHSQRIARALEVYRITGQPLSQQIANQQQGMGGSPPLTNDYRVVQLALIPDDRKVLHKAIEQRFMEMLSAGLIAEVEKLLARGDLSVDLPSMRAVGYRQVWAYLAGEYSYDQMIEKACAATRQLAKRQLTWLRSWPDLVCVNALSTKAAKMTVTPSSAPDLSDEILINTLNFLEQSAIYFVEAE